MAVDLNDLTRRALAVARAPDAPEAQDIVFVHGDDGSLQGLTMSPRNGDGVVWVLRIERDSEGRMIGASVDPV
jgi:hypothetical protein